MGSFTDHDDENDNVIIMIGKAEPHICRRGARRERRIGAAAMFNVPFSHGRGMLQMHPDLPIVVHALPDPRSQTNAVFLLGAYMIMKHHRDIQYLMDSPNPVMSMIITYFEKSPSHKLSRPVKLP